MNANDSFRTFYGGLGIFLGLLYATASQAVVTVDHIATSPTTIAVGEAVTIQVRVTWDGEPGLFGIFQSTASDDVNVLVGESAVSGGNLFRPSLFPFTDDETGESTVLGRFGQQLRTAVDPLNVVRSIQYGSLTPINPLGATANTLVTTITFRAVGAGTTTIGPFFAISDNGPQGNPAGVGATVTVTVPEPHQVAIGLAALGSVAGVVTLRRRF